MEGFTAKHKKGNVSFTYRGDLRECVEKAEKELEKKQGGQEGVFHILRAAVEEIYSGGLAKVTLNLRGGVKASISQNSKGEINVERTETKKQKLTE